MAAELTIVVLPAASIIARTVTGCSMDSGSSVAFCPRCVGEEEYPVGMTVASRDSKQVTQTEACITSVSHQKEL